MSQASRSEHRVNAITSATSENSSGTGVLVRGKGSARPKVIDGGRIIPGSNKHVRLFTLFDFKLDTAHLPTPAAKKHQRSILSIKIHKHCVVELFADVSRVERAIESFIRYLAVERGLSDNYQLSTQRSLSDFASWCTRARKVNPPSSRRSGTTAWRMVTLPM